MFWKRLWKIPMSQRWRMFCWKLAQNVLPTKENLIKRKITQSSSCAICRNNDFQENLEWLESRIKHLVIPRLEVSTWLKNFFNYLTEERSSPNPGWALLIVILRAIWTHRNNVIFRKAVVNPYGIMEVAKVEMDRWYNVFGSKGQEDRMQEIEEGRGPSQIREAHNLAVQARREPG
ncbi:hypothetical protein RDABS01_022676 [Bienertia sinuspersici]